MVDTSTTLSTSGGWTDGDVDRLFLGWKGSKSKNTTCKYPDLEARINYRDKVAKNTDRTDPKVPKLSDDRGCLDRCC